MSDLLHKLLTRPATRREFLCRSGMGFASLGLAGLMASQGLLDARPAPTSSPLAPKQPHFPAKAKRVIHLFMNGGPSHVDTFDPKPALRQVRRQAAAARTCAPSARPAPPSRRRSSSRSTARAASRSASSSRTSAECIDDIARHPLDARRRAQSRAVADADELRRGPADSAEHGLVGDLRPGQREPEPARLHRHVSRRLSDPGDAELAVRRSCPASTRAPTSTRGTPTVEKLIENIRNNCVAAGRAAPAARSAAAAQRAPSAAARSATPQLEARIQSFELAYRMQMDATDAFDVSREPQHDPRHVRPRHAGPADPDRPPAARTRRALRAGLARRGPAVGQPRRPRGQPSPAGAGVRPGHRRPAART